MIYSTFSEIVRYAKKNFKSVRILSTVNCAYYAVVYDGKDYFRTRAYVSRDFVADALRKRGLVEIDCITFASFFG